jgi:ribose 5-phosphate isomerase B
MKIIIGSDHLAFSLKEDIKTYLLELGHEVIDAGCDAPDIPVDYPDIATLLCERLLAEKLDRGILICGTGIGMAIVANKIPGIRAACCHDPYSAERARKSNNAQILTLGAQIVAPTLAKMLVDRWLASEFSEGRSSAKVKKINQVDERFRRL